MDSAHPDDLTGNLVAKSSKRQAWFAVSIWITVSGEKTRKIGALRLSVITRLRRLPRAPNPFMYRSVIVAGVHNNLLLIATVLNELRARDFLALASAIAPSADTSQLGERCRTSAPSF